MVMMTGSLRTAMRILAWGVLILAGSAHPAADSEDTVQARIQRLLAATPLIDGHNDLAWELRVRFKSDLGKIDLSSDTSRLPAFEAGPALMTDIPRMRAGHVGGQFWSVWVPTDLKGAAAVQTT